MRQERSLTALMTVLLFLLLIPTSVWAVVYVDIDNIKGPWDGDSWATAYKSVQEGLNDAEKSGDEVWVAEGTYKPTSDTDRSVSFRLRPGVDLYGGFQGTETRLDQRDWRENSTILSGDIGKQGEKSDNSTHVVVGADDAVIDGFTITGGFGGPPRGGPPGMGPKGGPPGKGGPPVHITPEIVIRESGKRSGNGMVNFQCAPTIRNCVFKDNHGGKGGAMYNMVSKSFRRGPGMKEPAPTVINCTFIGNSAMGRGGAVSNDLGTHPTFVGCKFINNSCERGKGGAMYNDFGCSPTIINCVFTGNSAFGGGAIGNDGRSSPTITNCTFTGNRAIDMGAALYQGTGPPSEPIVTNSILWGNICSAGPSEVYNWHESNAVIRYSCVEGGYPGEGNIDADPMFVDVENKDYRLAPGSPCIDSGAGMGTPEKDRDGNSRYDDKQMPNVILAAVGAFDPFKGPPPGGPPGGSKGFGPPGGAKGPGGPGPPPMPEIPPVDMGAYERQEDSDFPAQDVVYVDQTNSVSPWDGGSWSTAFINIQQGLDYAYAVGADVWVAKGVYRPTSTKDRKASFKLRAGVTMYGGFKGTETKRSERDRRTNVTVLSGDIGIPDDNSDNSYHVVVGENRAAMDGFTITGGNADGSVYHAKGGGMINYTKGVIPFGNGVSPIISNCVFSKNHAIEGGAMYNYGRCAPVVEDCTFIENSADFGGAVLDRVGVNTVVSNTTFTKNSARWRGGAYYMDYGSRPKLSNCAFTENSSDGHGGGVYTITRASQLEHTFASITNCSFTGNNAKLRGGGIASYDMTILEVKDSIFSENHAGKGGGGVSLDLRIEATFEGCTFIENSGGDGKADIDSDDSSQFKIK